MSRVANEIPKPNPRPVIPGTRHGLLCWITALFVSSFLPSALQAQWTRLNPVTSVQQLPEGVALTLHTGVLQLQICSDSIVRVIYAPGSQASPPANPAVVTESWAPVRWNLETNGEAGKRSSSRLKSP